MFKLKKKRHWLTANEKMKTQEYDRPGRLEFWTSRGGVRPVDYVLPAVVENLINNIEKETDEFLRSAKVDEYNNGSFFDEYIEAIIELGQNNLDKQFAEHEHIIEGIRSIEEGYLLNYEHQQKEIQKWMDDTKDVL